MRDYKWRLLSIIALATSITCAPNPPIPDAMGPPSLNSLVDHSAEHAFLYPDVDWNSLTEEDLEDEAFKRGTPARNFLRFGRPDLSFKRGGSARNFLRFGRRDSDDDYYNDFSSEEKRGGRNFLRFGRGPSKNFLRFGRSVDSPMAFVASSPITLDKKARSLKNFIRFGKRLEFGPEGTTSKNFVRFGRSPDSNRIDADNAFDELTTGGIGKPAKGRQKRAVSAFYDILSLPRHEGSEENHESTGSEEDIPQMMAKKSYNRSFLRFGRDPLDLHFLRFGKRVGSSENESPASDEELMRFARGRMNQNFIRFG